MKDVENRTWTTDYRGTLRIHASGHPFCWPPAECLPEAVQVEIEASVAARTPYDELSPACRGYEDLCRYAESRMDVKEEDHTDFNTFLRACKFPAFVNKAIIGEAQLIDIVQDSESPWAMSGHYHWILADPVWYTEPELGVKGRLRLW